MFYLNVKMLYKVDHHRTLHPSLLIHNQQRGSLFDQNSMKHDHQDIRENREKGKPGIWRNRIVLRSLGVLIYNYGKGERCVDPPSWCSLYEPPNNL